MTKLLTRGAAATKLSVSTRTIARWENQGKLIAIRLSNRCVRYEENEIDRLLIDAAAGRNRFDARAQEGEEK